jgi:hypothetical protein
MQKNGMPLWLLGTLLTIGVILVVAIIIVITLILIHVLGIVRFALIVIALQLDSIQTTLNNILKKLSGDKK